MGKPHKNEIKTFTPDKNSFVYLKLMRCFIKYEYSSIIAVVIASVATS